MIKDLQRIQAESILVDASVILAAVFTGDQKNALAEECSEFLAHCAATGILIHVTPEACHHLWKVVFSVHKKQAENRVTQSPLLDPLLLSANRLKAFLGGPVDLLSLSPDTFRQAADLWLAKQGKAGIEACIALCALQEIRKPPHFIATANHHYDVFEAHDVAVLKPSGLVKPTPTIKVRPIMDTDMMISD